MEIIRTNTALRSDEVIYGVSNATIRNWKRLNVNTDGKLETRANKRNSKKRVLPIEYFSNKENVAMIQDLLGFIEIEKIEIASAVLSLSVNLLLKAGLYGKSHVTTVLSEYNDIAIVQEIVDIRLPEDEHDFIGLFYQSYLCEGKKNIIGSYYTPKNVVYNMIKDFNFSNGQTFLDPCCGSGAFLLAVPASTPEQLFGIDNDSIAVLIAKVNLLLKFSEIEFIPQIYCFDFLAEHNLINQPDIFARKFDYIATNPPWGAMTNKHCKIDPITSKEIFSCFFVRAFEQLGTHGRIRFLFPEAILNVKTHRDIREYILDRAGLVRITMYPDMFSGVTTKYIDIECGANGNRSFFILRSKDRESKIDTATIYETKNLVFNLLSHSDVDIIHIVKGKGRFSLKGSTWALGIVTGDNKGKLFSEPHTGMEPIYTGKEIVPYLLQAAQKYLLYDRKNLQQVAKEEIYRAPEKLVYRFISNKLIFAYDNHQSLFLNSANILIPNIPHMDMKTVMAFLNSQLFQFMYMKLFHEVKILKGNLSELRFPEITEDENATLVQLVDAVLRGDGSKKEEIDNFVFSLYDLSDEQIMYIRRVVNGKADG